MWEIYEHKKAVKQIEALPLDILKRYEKWKDIVFLSGPEGLKVISGFRDEALKGAWQGHRCSRLNIQYRVIYRVVREKVLVQVVSVTPHDYRSR